MCMCVRRGMGQAILCIAECLVASLASTHQMSVAPPSLVVTIKKCLQTLPNSSVREGGQTLWMATITIESSLSFNHNFVPNNFQAISKSLQFYFQPYLTISVLFLRCLYHLSSSWWHFQEWKGVLLIIKLRDFPGGLVKK